jgi:hypothetical protein
MACSNHLNVITGYSTGAVDAAEEKPRKRTILDS